jgi:hypothetical protein
MQKASEMTVENLDHLGLIAGLIDEIGIVQKINELIGEYFDYAQHKQPGEIVSPGLVVKAMIINFPCDLKSGKNSKAPFLI